MKRVAVIGAGFGGLSAAGELARQGHHVTLFEGSSTLGGKAQAVVHDGVALDTGPTLLTMPDVVAEQFARLGATDLLPRFHRLALQSRYVWQDGRTFDCWEALERAQASAEALAAGEGAALARFFRAAEQIWRAAGEPYLEAPYEGPAGFMARVFKRGLGTVFTGLTLSTLDQLARAHFRSDSLQHFVGRFATYAGASPYEASAAFAMIAHLERAFGVHHVEGGMAALVRGLGAAVQRLGVDVRLGQRAQWTRRGPALLVTTPDGDERFDAVVVNQDPLAERPAAQPLAMSGFVFHVDVSARLAWPHHTILFSRDYRREFDQLFGGQVPDDPTIYVNHPAASDATMAPPGRSGLFVMVNAPAFDAAAPAAQVEAQWREHAARLEAHCLERLAAWDPTFAVTPKRVFARRTPVDLAARGAPGGSIYGFLPHGRFGAFRRPRMRSATPGVFYAGGGTYPGGGVFMVMLSGRFASGLVQQHLEAHA